MSTLAGRLADDPFRRDVIAGLSASRPSANRELDGDFTLAAFDHRALWNLKESRIEMHLISQCVRRVGIGGALFDFAEGDRLFVERAGHRREVYR